MALGSVNNLCVCVCGCARARAGVLVLVDERVSAHASACVRKYVTNGCEGTEVVVTIPSGRFIRGLSPR